MNMPNNEAFEVNQWLISQATRVCWDRQTRRDRSLAKVWCHSAMFGFVWKTVQQLHAVSTSRLSFGYRSHVFNKKLANRGYLPICFPHQDPSCESWNQTRLRPTLLLIKLQGSQCITGICEVDAWWGFKQPHPMGKPSWGFVTKDPGGIVKQPTRRVVKMLQNQP